MIPAFDWKVKAIETVSKNKDAFAWAPVEWRSDPDIVIAAVQFNPFAIQHSLITDSLLAVIALQKNGAARLLLPEPLRSDLLPFAETYLPDVYRANQQGLTILFCRVPGIMLWDIPKSIIQVPKINTICSEYIRDAQVTLLDGTHLIPQTIKDPFFKGLLKAMTPPNSSHMLLNKDLSLPQEICTVGKGFNRENVEQAIIFDMNHGLSFKRAKNSCIEGGNCFVFVSKGEKKAIIGEISLFMSILLNEENGFFNNLTFDATQEPSEHAYLVVRNIEFYNKFRRPVDYFWYVLRDKDKFHEELIKIGGEQAYRYQITASVSDQDKLRLRKEAQIFDAKRKKTELAIADEIGVPLDNICFIQQKKFHIDMEMTVMPDGSVLLNDPMKVLESLNEIERANFPLPTVEDTLHTLMVEKVVEDITNFNSVVENQIKQLMAIKVDVHRMALDFDAKEEVNLNFANGIFIPTSASNYKYITTGTTHLSEAIFFNHFVTKFEKKFSSVDVMGIEGLSRFVSKNEGGVRCLSIESTVPLRSP